MPARWRARFAGAAAVLASHRGYDIGALGAARALARALGAPLYAATTTRLLVDLNRSADHPRCLSPYTAELPPGERARIFAQHYWPHRRAVHGALAALQRGGRRAVHVAVHSFTPVLGGEVRRAEIGLLYDPARRAERALAQHWRRALRERGWQVRSNYPYRGTSDGLTTALRHRFADPRYAGLELELNQRFFAERRGERAALLRDLGATLQAVLQNASD